MRLVAYTTESTEISVTNTANGWIVAGAVLLLGGFWMKSRQTRR